MSDSRIAVIAIHGVGDHQAFEMAKAVGDMLEDLEDGPRQPRYGTFGEDWVRVNVAPVKVQVDACPAAGSAKPAPAKGPRAWGPLDALFASKRPVRHAAESLPDSLDHLFMEGQLSEYKGEGPEETYEVLRLKGRRMVNAPVGREQDAGQAAPPPPEVPEKEVHIYDMFWSDLSGVGTAGLRIFGELYQLLFHLGSIGVNNVKAAAITLRDTPAGPAWSRFGAAQVRAATLLALPIPILNLVLLAFAAAVVAIGCLTKFSVTEELTATALVLFAAGAGAWGYALMRQGGFSMAAFRRPVVLFLLASSAVSILATLNAKTLDSLPGWSEAIEFVAGIMVLIGAFAAVRGVVAAYEKRRPGANRAFPRCLLAVGGLALILTLVSGHRFLPQSHDFLAMSILLRFIEVTFWALLIAWLLFWIALVAAFFAGQRAVKRTATADPAEKDRAAHTNWTARLTLALPATLFLLVTFPGWAGLLSLSLPLLPHGTPSLNTDCAAGSIRNRQASGLPSVLCYTSLFPPGKVTQTTAGNWAWNTLFQAGAGYAPVLLLLVCFAAIISIWGLTPSVVNEVSPPRGMGPGVVREATAAGEWLDNGYRFMRWAGRLIYLGIFAFPLAVVLALLPGYAWVATYRAAAIPFQEAIGAVVAGAGIGILGLGGRLSKLALGFRPIVRVALDVDNWLREHPRNANPTARICGRYVSLLRYIAQWKDEQGHGYDALIVFAHSQGTVVTADLLRFLEVEARARGSYAAYDDTLAGLDRMNRYLFTMGCPLRQLYGLRFPYLYGYAPTGSAEDPLPRPEHLGVRLWVNAYRTGDYVGRHLWRPHPWQPVGSISFRTWDPPQGIPANVWQQGGRVEFSIGPGAHTHYWDSTAEPIAETLDVLIARANAPVPGNP